MNLFENYNTAKQKYGEIMLENYLTLEYLPNIYCLLADFIKIIKCQ